ncbi:DMT family transporter [Cerasibacillus terrae]|uniref:DMT family transporter n=1 Tax=Cerasibacillus terrae TaxID=2498845 RepID=A0A5C8NX52_9BACI|nr:DMT family transporter [Cerasibacillus terrae]TXL65724.1 DMT family transporter [Cerasibacillus terrae]
MKKGKHHIFHIGQGNNNNQLKADLMMVVVTMLWGSSYLFMKMGINTIQGFNLVGLRFGIAFIFAGAIFYKRLIKTDFKTLKYGALLGFFLFSTLSTVTIGMNYTSVSNAGFIFSLAVVFVPLLLAIFFKRKPEPKVIFGITLAVIGIALLTLNGEVKLNNGDFLITLGALFYALYIIVTDRITKHVDSINLGVVQLGFAGLFGFVFSFIFEEPKLPNTTEAWIAVLALGIFCSAIGFIGQTIAQKYTTPTRTGLIFSLEPVFAALFAFVFIGEILTTKGYFGAALILFGVISTKINWKKIFAGKEYTKPI